MKKLKFSRENIYQKYLEEKDDFFDKWYQYKEQKLSKFKYKPFDFLHYDNRIDSLDDYNEYKGKGQKNNYTRFGGSGLSALIVAYDSLLMSYSSTNIPLNLKDKKSIKFSIDSLIFFSTLHFGDNDTTGAIAGAWYGALIFTFFGFQFMGLVNIVKVEFVLIDISFPYKQYFISIRNTSRTAKPHALTPF